MIPNDFAIGLNARSLADASRGNSFALSDWSGYTAANSPVYNASGGGLDGTVPFVSFSRPRGQYIDLGSVSVTPLSTGVTLLVYMKSLGVGEYVPIIDMRNGGYDEFELFALASDTPVRVNYAKANALFPYVHNEVKLSRDWAFYALQVKSDSYSSTTTTTTVSTACCTALEDTACQLSCPSNAVITGVVFASYGTATGSCNSFAYGNCHSSSSATVLSACVGQSSCSVNASNSVFNGDPCYSTVKSLSVQVSCTAYSTQTSTVDSTISQLLKYSPASGYESSFNQFSRGMSDVLDAGSSYVGRRNDAIEDYLSGEIGAVYLYNRLLSSSELRGVYNHIVPEGNRAIPRCYHTRLN